MPGRMVLRMALLSASSNKMERQPSGVRADLPGFGMLYRSPPVHCQDASPREIVLRRTGMYASALAIGETL